jgi:hypothetical protein
MVCGTWRLGLSSAANRAAFRRRDLNTVAALPVILGWHILIGFLLWMS